MARAQPLLSALAPALALVLGMGLGLGLGPTARDAAGADGGAETFEVIVLRGASVARVTGDAAGALREETLREDPRPARRELRPESADAPPEPVVIVVETAPSYAPAQPLWWVGHHRFVHPHLRPPEDRPRRGVVPAPRQAGAPRVAAGRGGRR